MPEISSLGQSLLPVALILAIGGIYAVGRSRFRQERESGGGRVSSSNLGSNSADPHGAGPRRPPPRGLWFYLGLATLIAAMATPLDSYAERSLSAHMVQHVILMVIAPLLLVLADPWDTLVAGLPERVRDFGLVRTPTGSPTRGPAREPDLPRSSLATWTRVAILVTVVQSLVMWAWHIPALYDLAVRVDGVHAIEHLAFLGSGIWFWWAIGATGSRRNGMAALVVFIAALPGTALGAALMLAPHPWFPAYPDLQDQQVAGAIMWSVAGAVYLAGAVVLFISWLSRMEEVEDVDRRAVVPQNA